VRSGDNHILLRGPPDVVCHSQNAQYSRRGYTGRRRKLTSEFSHFKRWYRGGDGPKELLGVLLPPRSEEDVNRADRSGTSEKGPAGVRRAPQGKRPGFVPEQKSLSIKQISRGPARMRSGTTRREKRQGGTPVFMKRVISGGESVGRQARSEHI